MPMWLVEGLPGTGKSTIAEYLCGAAGGLGYDARWYLEESDGHPVHPKSLKAERKNADFIEACLHAWAAFTERHGKDETIHILEGSAFQSTVRFMMEEKRTGIADYYRRFEEVVAPLNPRMVYFRPQDALRHSEHVSALRGKDWTAKVSGYLERTQYAVDEGYVGVSGMHRFWTDYAGLCDEMVECARLPTVIVEFVPGEWGRHMSEAIRFLALNLDSTGASL